MDLANTSAIVTGGASGLGAATAAAFAGQGATVIALDLPGSIENAAAVEGVTHVAADVTDEAQVRAAVDRATADPAIPLRAVVNCAGIAPSARIVGRKGVHDLALYRKVVEINLIGSFTVLAVASEAIAQTDPDADGQRGVIINTASVAAYEGQVGQIAYAASKGGVYSMGICAARDLAQFGIRVNTIAPGTIETPMLKGLTEEFQKSLEAAIPFPSRLGRPSDYAQLANAIVEHDYLNGESIRMDGALRMAPR